MKHEMQRESEKSEKSRKIEKAKRSGRRSDAAENSAVKDDMDAYDYLECSCSATDCTGLIPNLADDAEIDAYQELYDFLPKAARAKKEAE